MASQEPNQGAAASGDFAHVDDAADPESYITFLERMRRDPVIAWLKTRSYAELDPQPGQRILEVACGPGDDVREMARLVAPGGQVIGLDNSRTMLAEARQRSAESMLGEEFVLGDMHHLPFADSAFDACRAERVLLHTPAPAAALAEMLRVLRPGGALAVIEPDLETHIVVLDDVDLARAWTRCRSDMVARGTIGRHLPVLLPQLGLVEMHVIPAVQRLRRIDSRRFSRQVERARERGLVTEEQASALWQEVTRRLVDGTFFQYTVFFLVAGRKPGS
jgi:ubiquinone/menaquinone biosynthesis C-methylase UbiE